MQALPFEFEIPVTFFEKADAGPGKMRRIGGIISTESPDRQEEVVLQRGLDFNDFLSHGWFNDNHSKETDGVLGYPELVKTYKRGQMLPNGEAAPVSGTWAEGYLLNTKKADRIWELGKALQDTGRRLGFSLEGSIQKRTGKLRKTIARAKVRNVAITNCPVNTDSRLDILAKSLVAVTNSSDVDLSKALAMGSVATPGVIPAGPQTGSGAGQVLTPESLERKGKEPMLINLDETKEEDESAKKALSDIEAISWVMAKRPDMSIVQAARFVELTKALKQRGRV